MYVAWKWQWDDHLSSTDPICLSPAAPDCSTSEMESANEAHHTQYNIVVCNRLYTTCCTVYGDKKQLHATCCKVLHGIDSLSIPYNKLPGCSVTTTKVTREIQKNVINFMVAGVK